MHASTLATTCYNSMFANCTSLTTVPTILPATTLTDYCYNCMFYGCTSLSTAPELPATILTNNCYASMFYGCTSLSTAPELPATILTTNCYASMFNNCTSLINTPSLNHIVSAEINSCERMFQNCISASFDNLSSIYCYANMFNGCTNATFNNLKEIKQSINTNYAFAFTNCISAKLTNITTLPDNIENANSMFANCKSLQYTLSTLPINLQYSPNMFVYTNSGKFKIQLYSLPSGLTNTVCLFCYASNVVSGNLNEFVYNAPINGWINCTNCNLMFHNGSNLLSGNYYIFGSLFPKEPNMLTRSYAFNGCPNVNSDLILSGLNRLIFTAQEDNCAISLNKNGNPTDNILYYLDKNFEYIQYNYNTIIELPNKDDKLIFFGASGNIDNFSLSQNDYYNFAVTGNIIVQGNLKGLINNVQIIPTQYTFYNLFKDCNTLTIQSEDILSALEKFDDILTFTATENNSAILLSAVNNPLCASFSYRYKNQNWKPYTINTILPLNNQDFVKLSGTYISGLNSASNYYNFIMSGTIQANGQLNSLYEGYYNFRFINLFKNCLSLITPPKLSLKVMGVQIYMSLFENCQNLTKAPELPANVLAHACYGGMFKNCTSLTTAPELSAINLGTLCYSNMFNGCTSLTATPILPAKTVPVYSYQSMFQGCTSLSSAPELPASTLANSCYANMFNGCTSLTATPILPAETVLAYSYQYMFANCTNLISACQLPATVINDCCYNSMFQNCINLKYIPSILPALDLSRNCYQYMFYNCSSILSIPELPATSVTDYCYWRMFFGCTSLTSTPTILPAYNVYTYSYAGMFANCINLSTVSENLLPASGLNVQCYDEMFSNCTNLINSPNLTATILANNCYQYMFYNCTKLKSDIYLPATQLVGNCYQLMFSNCSNLTKIEVKFTNWQTYTNYWVNGINSNGTFICPSQLEIIKDNSHIPTNWTVLNNNE